MRTDLPPIPWDEIPIGTTHVVWSPSLRRWYPRRLVNGTHYWQNQKTTTPWTKHKYQDQAHYDFHKKKAKGEVIPVPHPHDNDTETNPEEGYCEMNLENAALLVRDDISTVLVTFDGGNDYTYILHHSIQAKENDRVLVPANNDLKVGTVTRVDAEPQINVNSNTKYKWVICNVEQCLNTIKDEQAATDTIAAALKQKQASNVREQILQQFGVTNHQELLSLGQKKE